MRRYTGVEDDLVFRVLLRTDILATFWVAHSVSNPKFTPNAQ